MLNKKRNKIHSKQKMLRKNIEHFESKSWKEFITEKIFTDYALPLTKNVEAKLHELNKKMAKH